MEELSNIYTEQAGHFSAINEAARNLMADIDWVSAIQALEEASSQEEIASILLEGLADKWQDILDMEKRTEEQALNTLAAIEAG